MDDPGCQQKKPIYHPWYLYNLRTTDLESIMWKENNSLIAIGILLKIFFDLDVKNLKTNFFLLIFFFKLIELKCLKKSFLKLPK